MESSLAPETKAREVTMEKRSMEEGARKREVVHTCRKRRRVGGKEPKIPGFYREEPRSWRQGMLARDKGCWECLEARSALVK